MATKKPVIIGAAEPFSFQLQGHPEKTFVIPPISCVGYKDVELFNKINDEEDFEKRGELVKSFILKYAPEVEDLVAGEMMYFEIFNAYGLEQGKNNLGE